MSLPPAIPRTAVVLLPGMLVVAAATLVRWHDGGFGDHFGAGHLGVNNGAFAGRIAKNLHRFGNGSMKWGAPIVVAHTDPLYVEHYDRHPTVAWQWPHLWVQVLGSRALSIQVGAVCGFVLWVSAMALLAWAAAGPLAGACAGVVAAGTHLGAHYGFMMVSLRGTSTLVCLALIGWSRWTSSRHPSARAGQRWALLAAITFFGACLIDWWSYLLAPLLLADALVKRRPRAIRPLVIMGIMASIAMLVCFAHIAWIHEGAGAAIDHLRKLGTEAVEESRGDVQVPSLIDPAWWSRIGYHSASLIGWPALILAGVGLWILRTEPQRRLLLITFGFGLLNHLVLVRHAFTHEFWVIFFVPLVSLAAGGALARALGRESSVLMKIAAVALLVAIPTHGIARAHEQFVREQFMELPIPTTTIADVFNEFAEREDVVLTTMPARLLGMAVDATFLLGPVRDLDELSYVRSRFLQEPLRGRLLYVLGVGERDSPLGIGLARISHSVHQHGPALVYHLK